MPARHTNDDRLDPERAKRARKPFLHKWGRRTGRRRKNRKRKKRKKKKEKKTEKKEKKKKKDVINVD